MGYTIRVLFLQKKTTIKETKMIKLETPESFNLPANSSFNLKIKTVTDYCYSYIKA